MLRSLIAVFIALVLYFHQEQREFSLDEASIKSLHSALFHGRTTCVEVVNEYIARIKKYDSQLHSVLAINPHAVERASELDHLSLREKVEELTTLI